ncbi:MarR family winged helix-turn-helix transcriptional regulator [Streptomyces sp. NPDC048436]|uniref:MarR family winged helix-turn-helix transcriptional regulator n=1 Tax=Streptomyces sp. NPDC048436 TaxID=3365550 RepID=UPI003716E48D
MDTFTYSHSDEDLPDQPIGYWASAAGSAVVHHIRTTLAELGVTQPQWWILSQLVAGDEGRDRAAVLATLRGYLGVGDGPLNHDINALRERRLLAEDAGGRLRVTDAGRALQAEISARQHKLRAQIHEGVTEEEYIQTLKVLQRMIHNVGGAAWHE